MDSTASAIAPAAVDSPTSFAINPLSEQWTFEVEEFWWACQDDDLNTVNNLLENFPCMPLTVPDRNGVPPLYAASFYSSNSVLSLLLSSYHEFIDVNQQNFIGCTSLHAACTSGNLEGVKLLLRQNADLGMPNFHGITPLAMAEHHKHSHILEYLRAQGLIVKREKGEMTQYRLLEE